MPVPQYFIKDVNFDLDEDDEMTPHLAYTIAAIGGAASGWNDPLLLKSKASESPEVQEFLATLHKMKQDKELSSEGASPQDMLKGAGSNAPTPSVKQEDKSPEGNEMTEDQIQEIVKAAIAGKDAEISAMQSIIKSLEAKQEAAEKAEVVAMVKGFVADVEEAAKVAEQVFALRKAGLKDAEDVLVASLKKAHELLADSGMFKEIGSGKAGEVEVNPLDAEIVKSMRKAAGLEG